MEIRKGAPLELPHIMLLVNDKDDLLVGANKPTDGRAPIYDGDLMANGGHITGWALESKVDIEGVEKALNLIAEKNASPDGSIFLFAVGDGNHSLATAKAVWDEYKKEHPEDKDSPVRYALIEIVNIYDTGLTFEPIHRVIFNIDNEALIKKLAEKLNGNIKALDDADKVIKAVKDSWANFGFFYLDSEGKQKNVLLETKIKELAVARLQPEIDAFLKELQDQSKAEIDYIHGTDEVLKLGSKENSLGILLPPIAKDSFFETINGRGPLPRKSFSMGEADEKRFYLECRRLFS